MASTVMSLRIDTELLDALKKRSKAEGRSASAEVVRLISRELDAPAGRQRRPTMGMFDHFEAPSLDEFVELRKAIGKGLTRSIRRRAKRI